MDPTRRNIVYHHGDVSREDRERLLGQRGCVLWFTGLSGSGKSTVAHGLEKDLHDAGHLVQVLDGDNVRHGLCRDLGFGDADRSENIRRVAEVARLSVEAGLIVLTAFISPFRADRDAARTVIGAERFVEVFLDVPLAVCEQRDPKGLYRKVRAGEIAEFTGVGSPYEPPSNPELTVPTAELGLDECVARVRGWLDERGFLRAPDAAAP